MSLILDALRKIEQERRYADEHGEGSAVRAVAPEPSRRRRSMVLLSLVSLMAVIAAVSAVLTAVAFRSWGVGDGVFPETRTEAAAPSIEAPLSAGADVPTAFAPPAPDPPRPETPLLRRAAAPDPPPRSDEVPAAEPPPYVPSEAADPEPPGVFRLVGQGSRTRTTPIADSEPSETEADPDLPQLVLQGTSVIDGKPVAVISDQRVFEGDYIEGAVVVRISERAVELEFEGRRFTLTL